MQMLIAVLECTDFVCLTFRSCVISKNYQERDNAKTAFIESSRVKASDSGFNQDQVELKERGELQVKPEMEDELCREKNPPSNAIY